MTNEQALGRALALLTAIKSLDDSDRLYTACEENALRTREWDRLAEDIDKFLDDEMRRDCD